MRSCIVLCVLLLGTACEAGPDHVDRTGAELIGGALDSGDPGVVALLADIDGAGSGAEVFCTGTLVSARAIVTAAHCIDEAGANPEITAFFGADAYGGEGMRVGVVAAEAHPDWTGQLEGNHDIGMLLLGFPVDPSWATPLSNRAMGADDVGTPVRRVGFGRHDAELDQPDGKKRHGTTELHFISPEMDWFLAGDEQLIPCTGDSGGPVMAESGAGDELIGVHSFGFACESANAGATRIDLYADSFVGPWIDEHDFSCRADGVCVDIGCSDDPDCGPCAASDACTGVVGDSCEEPAECSTYMCIDQRCAAPCDLSLGIGCPAGSACEGSGSDYICVDEDEAGGSCRIGGQTGWPGLVLLGVFALARRRRRRQAVTKLVRGRALAGIRVEGPTE